MAGGIIMSYNNDGNSQNSQGGTYYVDENGNSRVIEADGLMAVCIQHEVDHLNGKVFVEYLSPLKRSRIKTKLRKAQRESAHQAA